MNVLVTGGNGQLGSSLKKSSQNQKNNYIFTDVDELDITDIDKVREIVERFGIKVIINCAAYTDVEKAEDDVEQSLKINVHGVKNLADVMKEVDGTLIHISTDYVFGSKYNTPIKEDYKKYGKSVYGITKTLGEQVIIDSGCKYIIIRTSWLYSEYGKNFVKTMMNLINTKSSINVVFDQVGTPTYAGDLSDFIVHIIELGIVSCDYGIYHYSNEGVCSWYDFTKMISKFMGNEKCVINPCFTSEFPSNVERPTYSVLDKSKIKNKWEINIPFWVDSLEKCIKNIQNIKSINDDNID